MRAVRRIAACAVWAALSMLCLGLSLFHAQKVCLMEKVELGSLEPEGVFPETARGIQKDLKEEQDAQGVCFFREQKKQWLKNEDLNRMAQGTLTVLCGSSSLLFPESLALAEDDTEGCLLGEEISYELFGIKNAEGRKVTHGDRELVVRGILKEASGGFAVQSEAEARSETDRPFLGLAVYKTEGQGGLSELASQYGLPDQPIAIGLYVTAAKLGACALGAIILICLLTQAGGAIRMGQRRPAFLLAMIVFVLALAVAAVYLTPVSFSIEKEGLPNQWSDFSWYTRRCVQIQGEWLELIQIEKGNVLLYPLLHCVKGAGFGAAAAVFFVFLRRRLGTVDAGRMAFHGSLLLMLAGCGAALFLAWKGVYTEGFSRSCLFYLLWIWGDYALQVVMR